MSRAGRLPVPVETKKLQGTDRKDREKEVVEFTLITVCPKPEVWMESRAKKKFKDFCQLLIDKCLLTDANVGHVAIMASEFARYEKATRGIKKDGEIITTKTGYQQPTPWIAMANQAQKNYRDYAALFGLDPVSATKVGGMKKSGKDPFEEMENKYKN